MKVETRDPWAFLRERDDINGFFPAPSTRVTFHYAPKTALGIAWALFWRALWSVIRRRRTFGFWLEDER